MHVDTCVSFVQPFCSGASSTSCIPRASFAGVTTAEPAKMCQKVHIRERKCQNNARARSGILKLSFGWPLGLVNAQASDMVLLGANRGPASGVLEHLFCRDQKVRYVSHHTHVACGLLRSQTGLPLCYQKQQDVLTPRQTDDKHVQHMSVTNTQPDLAPFFDSDKAFVFLASYIASKKIQDTLFIFVYFFHSPERQSLVGSSGIWVQYLLSVICSIYSWVAFTCVPREQHLPAPPCIPQDNNGYFAKLCLHTSLVPMLKAGSFLFDCSTNRSSRAPRVFEDGLSS